MEIPSFKPSESAQAIHNALHTTAHPDEQFGISGDDDSELIRVFKPTNTQEHFLIDTLTPVIAFMSGVNLGKSSSIPVKAMYSAQIQHPDRYGVRRTSFLFLRGTQSQILDTLIPTIYEWVHPSLFDKGGIRESPPIRGTFTMPCNDADDHFPRTMRIRDIHGKWQTQPYIVGGEKNPETGLYEGGRDVSGQRIGDVFPGGTVMRSRWRFIGIDHPDWIGDLRSTFFGSCFIEEADQISILEQIFPETQARLNRFPPAHVAPCTAAQMVMAYNPVYYGHFLEKFFDDETKEDRKLYRMPPPIIKIDHPDFPDDFEQAQYRTNPDAEGLHFAQNGAGFWLDLAENNRHNPDYITRMLLGDYTRAGGAGEKVFKAFKYEKHVAQVEPSQRLKIIIGCDFANQPAAVFAQWDGGLRIFKEMWEEDMLTIRFLQDELIPYVRANFTNYDILFTGDPTGSTVRDMGHSPFDFLREAGFEIEDDIPNLIQSRLAAVEHFMLNEGQFTVDYDCTRVLEGFNGGYQIDPDAKKKGIIRPLKKGEAAKFTHVQDCIQAIALVLRGGVEHRSERLMYGNAMEDNREERVNYSFL